MKTVIPVKSQGGGIRSAAAQHQARGAHRMGAGALGCIPHPHSKSLSFSCLPKCLLAEFCTDLASPCAIPAVFARPNSQRRPGESRPLPQPGKNRRSRDGKHKGKSLRSRIPATQKVLHRTSPGISLPKAKAWLARGASEPPPSSPTAPPLRGEFNSLPAGSLTLVCSEARNYKDLQEKKNPAVASQLHTGASPAAPWNCPLPLFPAAGSDSHSSPGWAQPENRDRNLLRGCAERVKHLGWNFGM